MGNILFNKLSHTQWIWDPSPHHIIETGEPNALWSICKKRIFPSLSSKNPRRWSRLRQHHGKGFSRMGTPGGHGTKFNATLNKE